MSENTLVTAGGLYARIAEELEIAARHSRVAAEHFNHGDVPRGCAHAFATTGHIRNAQVVLDEAAQLHASRATLEAHE